MPAVPAAAGDTAAGDATSGHAGFLDVAGVETAGVETAGVETAGVRAAPVLRPVDRPPALPAPDRQGAAAAVAFLGLTHREADLVVQQWGWPKFRAQQLRDWIYRKAVVDPAAMSNLSPADRATLGQRVAIAPGEVVVNQLSQDGTRKLLIAWADGQQAETVMIPDGPRRTACVSSQVGCPVGCAFCASGIGGVKGNLSAARIVEQVVQLNRSLAPAGERVTNVVFMGMGEPLANYAQVVAAIRVLHDEKGLNIGARRITLSTVGVPARMRELAGEALPINLAVSLHAPTQPLRKHLIPWAEHFPLPAILSAARDYFEKTGREITFEYILLAGVNDRPEHARQLAQICRQVRANVNLLRYNEVPSLPFKRPAAGDVLAFQQTLQQAGVNTHVRKSRGRDIDAACGQLRRREAERADEADGLNQTDPPDDVKRATDRRRAVSPDQAVEAGGTGTADGTLDVAGRVKSRAPAPSSGSDPAEAATSAPAGVSRRSLEVITP